MVDDDPALLRVVQLSLQSEGFRVTTARNGIEALQRLDQGEYDLIVLDLQMPQMDGRTFYREMRARGSRTPVMILSAFGADKARSELAAEASFNKPFDPENLIERISGLLKADHSGLSPANS